jgi:hypothetical protein
VIDCQSGEPVERYSSRTLWLAGRAITSLTPSPCEARQKASP